MGKKSLAKKEPNNKLSASVSEVLLDSERLKRANEELYKQGAELAFRNKTLSLLDTLYSVATKSIELEEVTGQLAGQIIAILDAQYCAIVLYNTDEKVFDLVGYSDKNKSKEVFLPAIKISSKKYIGFKVLKGRSVASFSPPGKVLGPFFPEKDIKKYLTDLNVLTTFVYPLYTESGPIGLLILGLNRDEQQLSSFEREGITSAVNVVAVAIDKASAYSKLKVANDRLAELVKLKGEFLSIASHQLRTPTSIAKGMLSMVLDGTVKGKQREDFIEKSFKGVMRLERIIRDLLNASELEGEKMKLECRPVDLASIIKEVVEERDSMAVQKKLKIAIKGSGKKYPLVMVDQVKIVEVIANLIDNAVHYTEKGTITLWCQPSQDKKMLELHVKDTGIGISKEDHKKLFQKFSRGERSPSINPNGSGLGLFIVKKIAEGCGGTIEAKSAGVNKGSEFIVSLRMA